MIWQWVMFLSATTRCADKPYDKLGFSIHNYFFAKSLDQVRPGGVVAFVTISLHDGLQELRCP